MPPPLSPCHTDPHTSWGRLWAVRIRTSLGWFGDGPGLPPNLQLQPICQSLGSEVASMPPSLVSLIRRDAFAPNWSRSNGWNDGGNAASKSE